MANTSSMLKLFCVLTLVFFLSSSAFAILDSGSIKVFAVTDKEEGIAADLYLYALPGAGSGQIGFITSNSLVGKDTQTTGNIALQVAKDYSKIDYRSKNFLYDIRANASEVDGPSAGAAMALLSYSLLVEKPIPKEVGITGTINSDGSVGVVGGVYPKAQAAAAAGIKLLMIPKGEANQVIKNGDKVESVNLLSYGPDHLGIKIVEVSKFDEVITYAYQDISSIKVDVNQEYNGFIPSAIKYSEALQPMKKLSNDYISRALSTIEDAKKSLEVTTLQEDIRSTFYPQLGVAERTVEMAKVFLDQNYLYSAANYSFNARVLAGTVKEISDTPSLVSADSSVLSSKISALEQEIDAVKKQMNYFPIEGIEWWIGAQQRIAYAENALAKIKANNYSSDSNSSDQPTSNADIMFSKVYDFVSAEGWLEAAKDFLGEADKSQTNKNILYTPDFVQSVSTKLLQVGQLLKDSNATQEALVESQRRFDSAKISFDNNFFFAALYDCTFAEAFINSEGQRQGMSSAELTSKISEMLAQKTAVSSIWANLFLDHARFFLENAKFEDSQGNQTDREANLKTSYDLVFLSGQLEKVNDEVATYLFSSALTDYTAAGGDNNGGPNVSVVYRKTDSLLPYIGAAILAIVVLLAALIIIGVSMRSRQPPKNFYRADKVNSVLHKLDRALVGKRISDAEYFFMKKRYEDEFGALAKRGFNRSELKMSLEESRVKLRALEKGRADLKRHYKTGLIIQEDFEKQYAQVSKEINGMRAKISICHEEMKVAKEASAFEKKKAISTKTGKWAVKEPSIKGTRELAKEEEKKEKAEARQRKRTLQMFNKRNK